MGLDKDDIKQLIAILQKGLSDDDDSDSVVEEPHIKRVKPQKKRTKNKKSKNLFENMSESNMHKDDIEIDKKLRKFPPTQRSRDYKPLKVRCRICGKEESTSPSIVESTERYKCNKCSTSAG
jgi:lysyl-tRNA synthetase class I